MESGMYKKVFVITKIEDEREWSFWCKEQDEKILYIKTDCTIVKKYSRDNVMIILNGGKYTNGDNVNSVIQEVINEIQQIENWTIPSLKNSIAFAGHGTESRLPDDFQCKFFDYTTSGGGEESERWAKLFKPIAEAIEYEKTPLFKKTFKYLLAHCNGKPINEIPWPRSTTINKILHSFLPLDIDMQALADEKVDKEKYLQEMAKDIDELYSSEKKKNTHYRQKLYDLWYLLGQEAWFKQRGLEYSPDLEKFTPINEPNPELYIFAGINSEGPNLLFSIHKFLESLDTGEIKTKSICKPFDIQTKDNNKNITTFHEWYIKLCEYLKMREV